MYHPPDTSANTWTSQVIAEHLYTPESFLLSFQWPPKFSFVSSLYIWILFCFPFSYLPNSPSCHFYISESFLLISQWRSKFSFISSLYTWILFAYLVVASQTLLHVTFIHLNPFPLPLTKTPKLFFITSLMPQGELDPFTSFLNKTFNLFFLKSPVHKKTRIPFPSSLSSPSNSPSHHIHLCIYVIYKQGGPLHSPSSHHIYLCMYVIYKQVVPIRFSFFTTYIPLHSRNL